jgi:hypothetical protein
MGMIATASHSFSVINQRVDGARCFLIDADLAVLPEAVYRYPFLQLAETTLAINLSGMTHRFLELCGLLFNGDQKMDSVRNHTLRQRSRKLSEVRETFFGHVSRSWDELMSRAVIEDEVLSAVSESGAQLVKNCRDTINTLYPLCGLSAADTHSEINRIWRNFHTASQHSLFNR